jgi:hypothetical protein
MNKCTDCKKIIDYRAKRCKSCENKRRFKNPKNHPMWNNGYTLIKHYCLDCKKEITIGSKLGFCKHCAVKGKNNPNYGNGDKIKGKNNPMFGNPAPHGKGAYYKNTWMRSSYEIAYAKYLDKNKVKWEYEPKAFDLGNCTYRPDFYLLKEKKYVEIKGFWRDDAKKKFNLFKKLNNKIKIVLLQKKELKKLGII